MKTNLQLAIEAETTRLLALSQEKIKKIREALQREREKENAYAAEAVRNMIDKAYGGVLRPWRCRVGAHNGGGSQMGGWAGVQEIMVLANSEVDALMKARRMATPMYLPGGQETAVPAWDE